MAPISLKNKKKKDIALLFLTHSLPPEEKEVFSIIEKGQTHFQDYALTQGFALVLVVLKTTRNYDIRLFLSLYQGKKYEEIKKGWADPKTDQSYFLWLQILTVIEKNKGENMTAYYHPF